MQPESTDLVTSGGDAEPVNVLLVDDTPAKLLTYEVALADLGENLIKAGSADEAGGSGDQNFLGRHAA